MLLVLQQLINGLVIGSVLALFALGFTLVFGVLRSINLAHGAVFTWGTFSALYAITELGTPLWLAFLLAMVGGGAVAVILEILVMRPLRKRNATEFSTMVASIGAALILTSLAQQVSSTKVMRFPFDTFPIVFYQFLGIRISLLQLVIVASVVLLVLALFYFMYKTDFGRQVRAVAVSEKTASLLGVNPNMIYVLTFFISGALAGAAGVIIGLAFNSVHFLMGEPYLLLGFVVVVLGGMGSIVGAVLAGLFLGVVQTMSLAFLPSGLSNTIIFSILFLALLFKPTGLFGGFQADARVARK
ncbi:branched-chain amino acid ABC transporter permease [Alcaligenes endophyticus]|uniref:Branched-chain amino acid ABC transporter permease n=1 Tax=Alcaligenes endophyticus TaxID=1929088 RepID=A0ABT8EFH7_9BURK|nr:branched-chain amino acid ABC transporter permease [Alcaligenes endophyticus]MCX5590305.1 branched-chain amino acid ABC transporter permease [Alcaligenes endophyticus]MDN4120031.1 branched-chain amino acid ABC transporter permease [Alcaligenes endophyticus]